MIAQASAPHLTAGLPVGWRCPGWPHKRAFLTADAASRALRSFWLRLWARRSPDAERLAVYPCMWGGQPHHHLGRYTMGAE